MKIKDLKTTFNIEQNEKLHASYNQLYSLLKILRTKEISDKTVNFINDEIDKIDSVSDSEKDLRKQIKKTQSEIIKLIEKEHKLVTKNHYRNTWLVVGMAVFGIPLGVVFGASLGNMGLLSLGLPVGMAIGIAVGSQMDKKAVEEGRQIDLEIKH